MLLYQVFILVLYGISTVSIALLLVTTYVYKVKWHPVVSVILWMSIPNAIASLLHYPLYDVLRQRLPIPPADRPVEQQHTGLAYFCATEAILLYIFSAIGSGLTVSFTLSLFAVVVKSKNPEIAASPRTWKSFRWLWDPSTTALCVTPFLWALPLLGAGIEALVRTSRDQYPSIYFSNTYCNIDDDAYQATSAVVLGLPLVIATVLVIAIIGMLLHTGVRNRGRASQSVNVPLALRFAAIVIQIFITAIVLICEISLQDDQLRGVFRLHIYWTGITPLIFFFIFGTQQDLMGIWKYWACRLIGKQPQFTPRSSNEAQTLSNTSAAATSANNRHVIHTLRGGSQRTYAADGKVHKASLSAGGRESASISDPLDLVTTKHLDLSGHSDRDLEAALSKTISKRSDGPPITIPDLPYMPDPSNLAAPTPTSTRQTQFSASAVTLSSQGPFSSQGHSGTHALLASQNDLDRPDPPLIVVTDGFGAMFGAQVPSSGHAVGQPIMSNQERRQRLAAGGRRPPRVGNIRERRRSVGLPPPPRSPRQSNGRPMSAGNATRGPSPRDMGAPGFGSSNLNFVSASTAAPWDWDTRVRASEGLGARRGQNDSRTASRIESDQDIELEEKIKTPSNWSFDNEHLRRESQVQDNSRDSWLSGHSRASITSDRTFG